MIRRDRRDRKDRKDRAAGPPSLRRVVHQASSLLLGYPGDDWPDRVAEIREALRPLPGPQPEALLRFCEETADTPPMTLAATYVTTFDRSRRRTLHLTYYTDGDTRRRGAALAALKSAYRAHGWTPAEGELPDHLPTLLEFAARVPAPGLGLLLDHRAALELLRMALEERRSPYAHVLRAVCLTLPGPSPADRAAALRMARGGPPSESVGLDLIPVPPVPPVKEPAGER
jgi:nitrate reductase molybdenum cofactor assembly chaperone NarJ/NarW